MPLTKIAFFQTVNAMTWIHSDGPVLKPAAYPPLSMGVFLSKKKLG